MPSKKEEGKREKETAAEKPYESLCQKMVEEKRNKQKREK